MPLIVKDLYCTYNTGLPTESEVLHGISFQAERGEILSIVGPTGSGKSTLAQHLNALLLPQRGEILVEGEQVTTDKTVLRSVRRQVGFVFQYPEQQIFAETVREEVAFGPSNWGVPRQELAARVEESLRAVGLDLALLETNPLALSGGQKRRVAIASVISSRPSYLVLDEPTAGLDAAGLDELTDILLARKKAGAGIIHVTHDLDLAIAISDKLLVLDDGREKFFGTASEAAETICSTQFSGLEIPPVLALSYELKKRGRTERITDDPLELADLLAVSA